MFYNRRNLITEAFEDGTFPLFTEPQHKKQQAHKEEKKRKHDLKKSTVEIYRIETGTINRTVFKIFFGYSMPNAMPSYLVNSDKK